MKDNNIIITNVNLLACLNVLLFVCLPIGLFVSAYSNTTFTEHVFPRLDFETYMY